MGAAGVTLGTAVGVLPGIGPALTVALLLPVTLRLDPTAAFIMFAGIYYGAMYGGSTTSILLNTPGESATIVTALEGHRMARAGRAGRGARHRGDRILRGRHARDRGADRGAPALVEVALLFGPAEYFALMRARASSTVVDAARPIAPRAAWRACSSASCSGWSASIG